MGVDMLKAFHYGNRGTRQHDVKGGGKCRESQRQPQAPPALARSLPKQYGRLRQKGNDHEFFEEQTRGTQQQDRVEAPTQHAPEREQHKDVRVYIEHGSHEQWVSDDLEVQSERQHAAPCGMLALGLNFEIDRKST